MEVAGWNFNDRSEARTKSFWHHLSAVRRFSREA